ncbi:MAG: hypothetical protein ACK4JE_01785 [Endomicrobiia bacterium]
MKTFNKITSEDNINWFKKLSLSKKLECIEEQIRTINFFRTLKKSEKHKKLYKRNNKKI